jgi:hypothetical protein
MTDYYGLCEAALVERIRTLTDFFPKSEFVTDDDAILNKGADFYVVVTPDTFTTVRADGLANDVEWNILMDVYTKFTTMNESKSKMKLVRAALLNLITPPCLNHVNGVSRSLITANGGLFQDAPNRPNFVWQTFIVIVTQRIRFTV